MNRENVKGKSYKFYKKINSLDKLKNKSNFYSKYTYTKYHRRVSSFKIIEKNINDVKEAKENTLITSKFSFFFSNEIKQKFPWISCNTINSEKELRFHNELSDFYFYIKPKEFDNTLRFRTYFLLKELITSRWPTWEVKIFGSFLVDLYLKDSDIDISVNKSNNFNFSTGNFSDYDDISEIEQLNYIYSEIIDKQFSIDNQTQIIYAKIPIIKSVCKETGIKIDICINGFTGIKAAQVMSQIIFNYPMIRPVVLLLKYILRRKNLNEAYTGGIGSFVIFNMVYAYILFLIRTDKLVFINNEMMSNNFDKEEEYKILDFNEYFDLRKIDKITDIGTLFYGFLNFYGFEFNYRKYGINNFSRGSFFCKISSRNFFFSEKLCVINILNSSQDISQTAFNYDKIVLLFQNLVLKIHKFDKFLKEKNENLTNKDEFPLSHDNSYDTQCSQKEIIFTDHSTYEEKYNYSYIAKMNIYNYDQ